MRTAIVWMPTKLGDVEHNMNTAEGYIKAAATEGAELIVFPEFFTTGFALNPILIKSIAESERIQERLASLSVTYGIAIGGSYLHYDRNRQDVQNTYGLFFPTGERYEHSKDIPTGLENFCYTAGDEISTFDTPYGRIGLVMCWEQMRWQTVARMKGKIDLLVGGSCWWNFAPEDGAAYQLYEVNRQLAVQAPNRLAQILGVPMLHASHKAVFEGGTLMNPSVSCMRPIEGYTLAIGANGTQISRNMEQAGYQIVEIEPGSVGKAVDIPEDRVWIEDMPSVFLEGFYQLNEQYAEYYQKNVKRTVEEMLHIVHM